ncbi:MAG TPA: hypothetical protein VG603_01730 [Chitinophagales bacterium]|nr:hypothetical protein [Chitinophagales bacterium]
MKKITLISFILLTLFSLNSCYVNRTTVGAGPVGKAEAVKYSKTKQMYLLWGLIALGQSNPPAPADCGYQVKSAFNFWDALVSSLTGGIFSMRTVKIMVFKNSPCDPAVQKLERKLDKKRMLDEKRKRKP